MDRSTKTLIWLCVLLLVAFTLILIFKHEKSFERELKIKKASSIHKIESIDLAPVSLDDSLSEDGNEDKAKCVKDKLVPFFVFDTVNITKESLGKLLSLKIDKNCDQEYPKFQEYLAELQEACSEYLKILQAPKNTEKDQIMLHESRRYCLYSLQDMRMDSASELFSEDDLFNIKSEPLLRILLKVKMDELTDEDAMQLIQDLIERHPNKYIAVRSALFATTSDLLGRVQNNEAHAFGSENDPDAPFLAIPLDKESLNLPIELFYQLEAISPDDADLPALEVTLTRLQVQGYEETKEAYLNLLDKYPNYPSLNFLLAKNEARNNNSESAISYMRDAITNDPKNSSYKETLRLLETGHLRFDYIFDSHRTDFAF